ncbi:Transcription cofactor HES-6 [Bagarius yarrelli]|uniref:Transcription cofactor HES-6 n=1 Tax=Bagarius yarrelli TaxID=175774 RepID=A0A556TYX1_BAGYA|nr:Transcription cofactor HES-6 [Bagarius yarrelli]
MHCYVNGSGWWFGGEVSAVTRLKRGGSLIFPAEQEPITYTKKYRREKTISASVHFYLTLRQNYRNDMTASNLGNGPEKNFNAKEERKLRKPLIEKRRRERINSSLEQLKGIMVDAYNLDQSKLEKADVLEITVQHMEGLQRGIGPTASQGPSVAFESRQRYSSGYIQCMHEVHNLLLNCSGMDKSLGARLLNHLLKALPQISGESGTPSNGATTSPLSLPSSPTHSPLALPFQPRSLQLHNSPSPASPTSPSSPHCSPRILLQREGAGMRSSPSRSPSPQLLASSALPPVFPGVDPSMWRPW